MLRCCPGWSQQPGDYGCLSGECRRADTDPASGEAASDGARPCQLPRDAAPAPCPARGGTGHRGVRDGRATRGHRRLIGDNERKGGSKSPWCGAGRGGGGGRGHASGSVSWSVTPRLPACPATPTPCSQGPSATLFQKHPAGRGPRLLRCHMEPLPHPGGVGPGGHSGEGPRVSAHGVPSGRAPAGAGGLADGSPRGSGLGSGGLVPAGGWEAPAGNGARSGP